MFRDILSSSRVIFIGLVFFVLVVGGSLLYSWHVHRTTDAELAETQRKVQPLKNKDEKRTAAGTVDTSTVNFEHVETDPETDDAQMPDNTGVLPIDETSEVLDMADAFLPNDFVSEEEIAEDVPVSPFGFGPYPEIPIDYPENLAPAWTWSIEEKARSSDLRMAELMSRVLIKLWNQGERHIGGSTGGHRVYPHYPKTVYASYIDQTLPDGTVGKVMSTMFGGPDISHEEMLQISRYGKAPGITVIDAEDAGINPYTFLTLE